MNSSKIRKDGSLLLKESVTLKNAGDAIFSATMETVLFVAGMSHISLVIFGALKAGIL